MTRLVAIGAGLLLVGTAALFAVVLWLVDPETLGPLLETEIERATAGEATLGAVEFSLFPLPALSVRDLKLLQDGEEILTANSIRVRVSLFSALVGRVVLTALELEDPVVRLALDEEGRPVIPLARANEDGAAPGSEAASAPALAIR